jgi:hypothetical protein
MQHAARACDVDDALVNCVCAVVVKESDVDEESEDSAGPSVALEAPDKEQPPAPKKEKPAAPRKKGRASKAAATPEGNAPEAPEKPAKQRRTRTTDPLETKIGSGGRMSMCLAFPCF